MEEENKKNEEEQLQDESQPTLPETAFAKLFGAKWSNDRVGQSFIITRGSSKKG